MRIAYCLNSISYIGGIETVTIVKANALADLIGNEVFIVITDKDCRANIVLQLSPKVKLINLDVNYYADDWKSLWHVLKGIFVKRRLHKKRLAKALNEILPDVVISVGQSEKYMLPEIRGNWVTIRELHYRKDFRRFAASSRSVFCKISAQLSDIYDYCYKIGQYDQVVILTQEDKALNWKRTEKVSVIPNPLTFHNKNISMLDTKKVITVGRLSAQKNFSSLIHAFRSVADYYPDWILEIYGEGNERTILQKQITRLHLENNVYLCGNTSDVQSNMCSSSIFVLSSIFEGLPLVMLEAMSCGLPVVSYDCPCGPKDIITDGVDGFLVPTGDEKMLAQRICYLIENSDVRTKMGGAAFKKSENYHIEIIISMWINLFERLIAEKRNKC